MMKKTLIVLGLMLISINIMASIKKISTGPWRFVLQTNYADIPFLLDFRYQGQNLVGVLHNGKETIELNNITYSKGEISIPLQSYELSLQLTPKDKETLVGNLVRHNKNPIIKTPVIGVHGIKERFTALKEVPSTDITGKWALMMKDEKDQDSPGIGIFIQKNGRFTGSILTQTGDYRYIEGYVSANNFEAASFDGVYNYAFKGNISDGKMQAAILSNSTTKITGQRDTNVELPDAYKQTEIKELKFIFPDLKGQNVTLNHPKFQNKPVIVQIYGSWCPNCTDEMNFLIPWYEKNNKRGIEIIALAFERSLSIEEATRQLLKVQKKLNVPYLILQAGSTAEDKPSEKLPGLTNFISFPTTIFLNKKHEVVKVHAGFNGPSTGEYFEKWKNEFNQTIDGLVK